MVVFNKIIKKYAFVLMLFAVLPLAAQDFVSSAQWQSKTLVVDGSDEEWEQPFKFYNREAGLTFSIANDSNNLYLCFVSDQALKVVKMLRAGWSLRLSSKERKRRVNAWIDFAPIVIELEPKHDYIENQEKKEPTFNNWLDDYRLDACQYTVYGFKKLDNKRFKMGGGEQNPIQVALNYTPKMAVYEIAIPLEALFPKKYTTLTELMKLKVNIYAVEIPNEKDKLTVGPGGGELRSTGTERLDPKDDLEALDDLYYKANFLNEFKLTKQ